MRRLPVALALFGLLFLCGRASAQQCTSCDCFWHREHLTGDMLGLRSGLADRSVNADLQLTQFYQGVASGGREQTDAYGGKLDYFFTFVEGLVVLHAETRFGQDVILDAAGAAPVNVNMLYPGLENTTSITGLQINLPLTDDQQWIFTAGKINTLDLFHQLYPQTGRGIDGFMNASSFLPLSVARTVPLSFLGAGVLKMHERGIQGAALVYDSHNTPTTSGFDELFDNGMNVAGAWRFFTDFGCKPGSHLFMGTWASGDYTSLDGTDWAFLPGTGIVPGQQSSSWSFLYVLEQQLWADRCNPQRNLGLLAQWGTADSRTSPFEFVSNVSLQSQGLLPCRTQDTMGVAYFYNSLSDDAKDLLNPPFPLGDVHGVELYYNAEITPWFHLTADLQVVDPALIAEDTALVLGLRGKIDL